MVDTYNALANAITNIGFPIVAFFLMYKLVTETIKENTKAINKMNVWLSKILEKEGVKNE